MAQAWRSGGTADSAACVPLELLPLFTARRRQTNLGRERVRRLRVGFSTCWRRRARRRASRKPNLLVLLPLAPALEVSRIELKRLHRHRAEHSGAFEDHCVQVTSCQLPPPVAAPPKAVAATALWPIDQTDHHASLLQRRLLADISGGPAAIIPGAGPRRLRAKTGLLPAVRADAVSKGRVPRHRGGSGFAQSAPDPQRSERRAPTASLCCRSSSTSSCLSRRSRTP